MSQNLSGNRSADEHDYFISDKHGDKLNEYNECTSKVTNISHK